MPRACTVCIHPDRDAIDAALIRGASSRDVAARFGIGRMAAHRHGTEHVTVTAAESPRADLVAKADTLLDKIAGYERTAHRLLAAAESEKDYATALKAVRELTRIVELLAKLNGDLDGDAPTVNVLVAAPEWLQTQRAVLEALRPFPEAKAAVLDALKPLAVAA